MSMTIEIPTIGSGYSVKATVQRHVTEDETICFEGAYKDSTEAEIAVASQLALCRLHMAKYNEEVRAIDQKKSEELERDIQEKGEVVKKLNQEIALATASLDKATKRLRSA